MIAQIVPRPSAPAAAAVLREVFGHLRGPVAFRLWDGREVRLGGDEPACTVVIRAPETFARLMDDPAPARWAEAYIEDRIDIQGDLFRTMEVANEVEEIRLTVGQRLRILATLLLGREAEKEGAAPR